MDVLIMIIIAIIVILINEIVILLKENKYLKDIIKNNLKFVLNLYDENKNLKEKINKGKNK